MSKNKDTFCILPWIHVSTSSSGNYRVCCNSLPEKNAICDNDGNRLKLLKHPIKTMWNIDYMKSLRKEMMNGIEPKICKKCFQEEKIDIISARQIYNMQFDHLKEPLLKNTLPDGFSEPYVGYIDIRLGNICNLRCVMCNPGTSNQWVKEWSLINEKLDDNQIKSFSNMNWFEDGGFMERLIPYLKTTEMINMMGGEPTLSKSQYHLLDKCIELDVAKNIILKYNTNLTNIPNKLLEYWDHFKGIRMNVSIDAYGALNDYIRFPSKWKIIDRNLKRIDHMAQKNKKWRISIHCCIQMYNILHLTPLFDYLKTFDHIQQFPYLNILDRPEYLNIRVLPLQLKDQATDILENWKHDHLDHYIDNSVDQHYFLKIDGVIKFMYNEDWSHLFEEFKTKTQILDKSRKLDIFSVVPEFKDYYE